MLILLSMRKKPANPKPNLKPKTQASTSPADSSSPGRLYLEFCGEDHTLSPGNSLSFGRDAELLIDENPYMHRVLGRFVLLGHHWCIQNLGKSIAFTIKDSVGKSSALVAPGSTAAILHGEFTCRFVAGPTRYEISGALEGFEWDTDLLGADGAHGTKTMDWGRVELNDDQRLLLLALCEQRLLDPQTEQTQPPSNRHGAARLGWSLTKFNRKLDHLCEKLHRAGITNVHGGLGANATDRRWYLIEHALQVQLVSVNELHLIDAQHRAA
ncbi:unannotated protein [freshwater metagenome]|uniref:Unannotated protein n=1 Tax=freshwater metagenome TaxID=449393 RepID=A0A6J6TDX8_9ZZZZ